ncbi:inorganic polyphosphate kinase [Mangrovimonas yunxiaonensis]|uniref:Inorganic polyphosphate kinase n=1 Tax=Mangrovimonas yunxiaonensis TaxID=1197477 RepID=A0A084TMB0_9FLAO|nr:DUF6089 family protein [Mangrovimonas yunxiaonensis]KFB01846.1 inorganic polyphosphate kinase [Mangrovimonas yunxiaonensis]MBR9757402.1 hypothetical protein [Algicola sp.]GGH41349.1 hypothetical protein GCM10011364_12090 [Mangrovimonas yunxiaonensis]
MRHLIVIIFIVFSIKSTVSQTHEIGVFIGGSNFIGDVGATTYIAPNSPVFGGLYKWNRSPRHAFRFSLLYSNLEGDDLDSDDPRRLERGYNFENDIIEASLGLEFTFLDFDLHDGRNKITPYLFSGISVAHHDNFFFNHQGRKITENTTSLAFGIPMVLGIKARFMQHFVIGFEVGARYTFSDEIDGSVPDFDNEHPIAFGNTNNNDWYMFTGLTLTYTFGRKPCFCVF